MESFLTVPKMTSYFCEEVDAFASCCMTTDKPSGDKVNQIFLCSSTVLLPQHWCPPFAPFLPQGCSKGCLWGSLDACSISPGSTCSGVSKLSCIPSAFSSQSCVRIPTLKSWACIGFKCLTSLKGSIILVNTLSLQIPFISSLTA